MKLLGDPNEQRDINTSVNWVWNITTVNIFLCCFVFLQHGSPCDGGTGRPNRSITDCHEGAQVRITSCLKGHYHGWLLYLNTVEPPCATTSRKPPHPISDRQSKTPKFSQSKSYSWNLLVNDHLLWATATTFWAWRLMIFHCFYLISFFAVCTMLLRIYEDL